MNHAGEISRLVSIAGPTSACGSTSATRISATSPPPTPSPMPRPRSSSGASASDLLVCNADDPLVMARVTTFAGRTVTFGMSPAADVRADEIVDRGIDGSTLRLTTAAGAVRLEIPLLGRGNVSNVLAAAAVAAALDVPLADIAARGRDLRPAAHRGAVLRLPGERRRHRRLLQLESGRAATGARGHRGRAARGASSRGAGRDARARRPCPAPARGVRPRRGGRRARSPRRRRRRGRAGARRCRGRRRSGRRRRVVDADQRRGRRSHPARGSAAGDLVLVKGSRGVRTDTVVDRITAEFG